MGSKEPDQRGSRTTQEQKEFIVNYMYAHRGFAHGKFGGPLGADGLKKQWKRLSARANIIEGGNAKTVMQYQRLWADIKKRAKTKATELIIEKNHSGHFPQQNVLGILDRKVLAVMGRAAVEGIPNTQDSLPSSKAALLRLMAGDRSILGVDEPRMSFFETYGIGQDPIDQLKCDTTLIERNMNCCTVREVQSTSNITAGMSIQESEKSQIEVYEKQQKIVKECQDIVAEFEDTAEWDDMLD